MNMSLDDSDTPKDLAQKGSQQGASSGAIRFNKRQKISYELVTSPDGENAVNKAFDLLFQEVMRIRKSHKPHEINRDIRPGFDRPARG